MSILASDVFLFHVVDIAACTSIIAGIVFLLGSYPDNLFSPLIGLDHPATLLTLELVRRYMTAEGSGQGNVGYVVLCAIAVTRRFFDGFAA